ncbi:hypothetical protein M0R45_001928 [Rubus argutus]|uniref:Uncharacterized protein n=1 Tax=Rubus argutus TaxID=59490 RepID=A0AAW1VJ28_RUBAR
MAIYSNIIKFVNGMDLWSRNDEPTILPPQYTRQPGRPKTKRIKNAYEKVDNASPKLGKVQRSLRCSNYGVLGHNLKTCHRHLPPKAKKAVDQNKKRKLNSEEASSYQAQANSKRKPPLTKNELRQKAEKLKKKRDERKAATTQGSDVNVAASAKAKVVPSNSKAYASTKGLARSSSRIKENSKGGRK